MIAGAMKEQGFRIPALDVLYWDDWRHAKLQRGQPMPDNNPLDCNQPSGFAFLGCMQYMLHYMAPFMSYHILEFICCHVFTQVLCMYVYVCICI